MEKWKARNEKWTKTTMARHDVSGPQISYEPIATPVLEPEPRWYA
jgi:succinate dehydrogenase / fumarate reductase flavoprotein subunit